MAGTPTITHAFESAKADGPDPTLIQPSNWNDDHVVTGPGFVPIGTVFDYAGHTAPQYCLECYGQSVSSVTYSDLKDALVKSATATITIASPGVVTWSNHGRLNGDPVKFSTTGALPTGLTAGTTYYVVNKTTSTFQLAATPGGAAINTSGSQSGTHTAIHAPHGCANDLSTFNIPDLRGRVSVGYDSMGGTSADRLTGLSGGVNGDVMGASGGVESHTLTSADVPSHTHSIDPPSTSTSSDGSHTHSNTLAVAAGGAHTHANTLVVAAGGGHTHAHTLVVSSGGSHSHTFSDSFSGTTGSNDYSVVQRDYAFNYSGGGSKTGVDNLLLDGPHTHTFSGSVSGTTSDHTGHTHSLTGSITSAADHTHSLSGSITSAADHTHSISGSISSGGSHTHTVDIGSFTSGSYGSSGAHNNVQPSLVMRKVIFAGV